MNNLAVCIQYSNKNVSPKDTILAIKEAGFENVFIQYYYRDNYELDQIKQIDYCRELGLNIIFCHLGYDNINEIWIEGENGENVVNQYIEDLDLMYENKIDMVVMHLITHKESPMYNELGLERIKRIVAHAKKLGIKIAFENTRKRGYLEFVLKNIKEENVGICFDAGHYHCYFNDDFDFEFFKDRVFAVHIHDNDKTSDSHLLPFDGTIDWDDVLQKLKQSNYNGPITLELCYRFDYLKDSVADFYKEGYRRGQKLEEIFNNI